MAFKSKTETHFGSSVWLTDKWLVSFGRIRIRGPASTDGFRLPDSDASDTFGHRGRETNP